MADEHDMTTYVEDAWVAFRVRLADRLADLTPDDSVLLEVQTGVDPGDLDGAEPYLQMWLDEAGLLHAEVSSNHFLDVRFGLGTDDVALLSQSWQYPDEEVCNWHQDVQRGDVDRLALSCVGVLRDVFGVLHPVFVTAEGLTDDRSEPGLAEPVRQRPWAELDQPVLPRHRDDLVSAVDEALLEMVDDVDHDGDGDVPFRAGSSVVFVRVRDDRPAVEIFADLVIGPDQPGRLPVELDILNRTHDLAKFFVVGDAVRMSYELVAWPFMPRQLLTVLRRLLDEVDVLAESLAMRVGGRRFLDPLRDLDEPGETSSHPGMVALLELLHLGPVASPAVAALFDSDRTVITRHLTDIRLGAVGCGVHDEELVLTCLRRGLRFVVDGEIPERRPHRVPPRRPEEQIALLDDESVGEDTLDLGWTA